MPRAVQRSGGYNIFSILNLILNAIGILDAQRAESWDRLVMQIPSGKDDIN